MLDWGLLHCIYLNRQREMRKAFSFAIVFFALSVQAQELPKVPMAVSISEASSNIPEASREFLTSRLNSAVAKNGMGATDDFTQFYLSCSYKVVEKHTLPGPPAKYFNTVEMNYFVVDAFAQKIFSTVLIETKGVGNSEEQASMAAIRKISPSDPALASFIGESNRKIANYYDEQYKNIIVKAKSLAKVYKYDEALFQLSLVPEVCSGYDEVAEVADDVYQKYLDDNASKALVKARAIWNAGQDSQAATEAGEYLAEILPDAACYPEAVSLSNEIKAKLKSDVDYYRKREEIQAERDYRVKMERAKAGRGVRHMGKSFAKVGYQEVSKIQAWKEVGMAYGNNQKSEYYDRRLF